MISRRILLGLPVLFALAATSGCAKSSKDLLPGAVYAASVVPVYRNAELTDQMGSDSWGDDPDSHTKGQAWFFKVKDPMEKVLAFYESKFPNAERTTEADGSVTFRIILEGTEKYEYVDVTVREGKIQIGENVQPGKIKG